MHTQYNIESIGTAFRERQFEVYYQPQYSTVSMTIQGFEALVRWRHPLHGILLPSRFLPYIEKNGLLDALSEFVLGSVCEEIAFLGDLLGERTQVSVNVSPFQLEAGFSERAIDLVASLGIHPSRVEFELTEGVMAPSCRSGSPLHRLVDAGFGLAIDDFGSGYSSLGRLCDFPFHRLKLDRSLLKDIRRSPPRRNVFESIVTMARKLDMEIVAEGVETAEELSYVASSGVPVVQGFLCCPPLPAPQIRQMLANQNLAVVHAFH